MSPAHEPARLARRFIAVLLGAAAVTTTACTARDSELTIALASSPSASLPVVRVSGLAAGELRALQAAGFDADAWQAVMRVTVADSAADQPAIAGRYAVTSSAVEFAPMFAFDPGRRYHVRFDRGRIPDRSSTQVAEIDLSLAAPERKPAVRVAQVFPSAGNWPENILRIYIQFSGPMSRSASVEHVTLRDDRGQQVVDPFLPMELDLWNQDYTRCTVFFDPGRVKSGLVPHEELGRALEPGRTYTIEISAKWRDQHGQPLLEPYRQTFTVGPADLGVVRPEAWTITAPAAGTREPVAIALGDTLDHGLLQRTIGVRRAGQTAPVEGVISVGANESEWRFVPSRPWSAGGYDLVVLSILEDPAGNRVGRLFEVDRFDKIDERATPAEVRRPFEIR